MAAITEETHPLLVAEHTDEGAREMLRAVARGRGVLVVQLIAAPLQECLHVLEVNAPGRAPERFFAEPVGAPCNAGFPLKLEPYVEPVSTDIPPSSRSAGFEVSSVPDLALDSLPPRRLNSLPIQAPTSSVEQSDSSAWLLTGSSGAQSSFANERVIDSAWLAELTAMVDVAYFAEEASALAGPVRLLLQRGDAAALSAVITTLRSIMRQDNGAGRTKYAGRILRILRDGPALARFVDEALGAADEPAPALQHLLLETQAAAAEALCAGRQRHGGTAARARFVRLMRALGPAAMVSLAAALQACLVRGERGGEHVEDLLRAIPSMPDEATGVVVAELLRGGPAATTTCAALSALPALSGERARPLVLSALGHPDPGVVSVAINGLRTLRAIDAPVVRRLEPIVTGIIQAPEELRVTAVAAMAEALPEARMDAAAVALRGFGSDRGASPAVTVALARALLALGAPNAASLVHGRAATSPEPLRQWLTSLLAPLR